MENKNDRKLSFVMLAAMIIGSTVGSGIFTVTADMAASGAHAGAILIGWAICGVGMLGLTMSFFGLNKVRPDLTNGIYSYAREGFGEFLGFSTAWGYWISALLCNVSYATLLFGAIGYFFPAFGDGNNLLSIICASVLIWLLCLLILRGVKEATIVNVVTTISKLVPILVFIVAIIFVGAFKPSVFMENFWGDGSLPVMTQIKATTSATVWSFIGIEGAVVLSGRARRSSDVGKASLIGFLGILAIYVMVAILSLGTVPVEEMAEFKNPQMAQILEAAVGPWGAALINIGVILSLAGSFLGWTILAADCPHSAAQQGVFTKAFARSNKNEAPTFSLVLTTGIIQLFLIILYFNASTYQIFYVLSAGMAAFPYLFSAAFYLKVAAKGQGFEKESKGALLRARIFALIGTVYGLWMAYSMGLSLVMITTVLYAPGIIIYLVGRKERGEKPFDRGYEKVLAAAIVILAVISLVLILNGTLQMF